MSSSLNEQKVLQALKGRRDRILAQADTLTLKKLRYEMESELGLDNGTLKPFKEVIAKYVDSLLFKGQSVEEQLKSAQNAHREPVQKKGREFTKRFLKMRDLCRQATIPVPPNVYRKDHSDQKMEEDILEVLRNHGLTENSSRDKVQKVKQKLAIARDLDGIDTGNIIEDSRRTRGKTRRRGDEHTVRISSDDDSFEEDSEDLDSNDIDEEVKEEEKQRLEESEQQCEHKKKRVADWSDDDD